MKFQPKRFVVEVKRGTSRSAFSSPDAGPDKFSSAEAMLFGTPRKDEPTPVAKKASMAGETPRRILESLIAPPEPEPLAEEPVERPRRGRKPGSKNKPKIVASDIPAPVQVPALSAAVLAFMQAPEPARRAPSPAPEPLARADELPVVPPSSDDVGTRRVRLRERSSIIRRYVLGISPQPGQTGSLRARREARAAR